MDQIQGFLLEESLSLKDFCGRNQELDKIGP